MGAITSALVTGCAGTSEQHVASETETTSETTTSVTTTTRAPDCASTLPTAGQAAQLLMVMVPEPAAATADMEAGLVGGFGLKGNQSSDIDEEISEATADLPLPATVAVDEEGGTVQRLRYSAGRLPSAEEMAEGTSADAAAMIEDHAKRMSALGVTMNFAPVADVGVGTDLGSRTYGDDPAVVGEFAAAAATATSAGGVTPVVKHWPGIGGADVDPHEELPVLAGIEELRATDMVPFRSAFTAGTPAVMVAHAEVPGLTAAGEPVSLSRAAITDELRGNEGFGGVVITDSLGMGAVVNEMTQADAAERAIAAGADIALLSGTDVVRDAHARIVEAVEEGRIPADQVEASVRRVLGMRGIEGECFDAVSAYAALARIEAQEAAEAQARAEAEADAEADPESGTDGDSGSSTSTTDSSGRVTDSGINDAD